MALSQQLSLRLILGCRLLALHKRNQSSLPYYEAWSEYINAYLAGLRLHPDIVEASNTISLAKLCFIDQPFTLLYVNINDDNGQIQPNSPSSDVGNISHLGRDLVRGR